MGPLQTPRSNVIHAFPLPRNFCRRFRQRCSVCYLQAQPRPKKAEFDTQQ